MAVETSDYGTQGNRNSGSIGVYFRFCWDECLRRWADLNRLRDSGGDSGGDPDSNSGSNSGSHSAGDSASHSAGDSASNSASDSAGNLVLGHQFQ
jgi:hypothetical protein